MKLITAISTVAILAFAAGCENTEQPDIAEAYAADLTDGTSSDTDATEPAAEEKAEPKTAAQAEAEDATKSRRNQAHSADRVAKEPLKAE